MDCMLPVSWSICLDVGRKYAGAVTGAMNMAGQAGSFISSVAFGYMVTYFGSYNPPLIIFAVMLAISAAIFTRIDPTEQLVPEDVPRTRRSGALSAAVNLGVEWHAPVYRNRPSRERRDKPARPARAIAAYRAFKMDTDLQSSSHDEVHRPMAGRAAGRIDRTLKPLGNRPRFRLKLKGSAGFRTRITRTNPVDRRESRCQALAKLASDTDEALAGLGVERETKKYSPHLTLARIKDAVPLAPLRQAIAQLPSVDFGSFTADRFHLYRANRVPAVPSIRNSRKFR